MDSLGLAKIPPQNIEAEQSVLGCMLLDREAISTVASFLKSRDFYREDHKEIFEVITILFETAQPVDLITVSEMLRQRGTFDNVGGIEYLTRLANIVPSTSNAKHYAKIVEEKSLLRTLIKNTSDVIEMAYEGNEEVDYIFNQAEKTVFDILQRREVRDVTPIRESLTDAFNKIEELYNNKGNITGIPTKFDDLDEKLAGLHNSDLIIVAARPAMGKSAFGINIAQNAAIRSNVPVAIFSFEMSKEQIVNRILCSEAMVDSQKIKTGSLGDKDWAKLAETLGPLSEAPIYIDDNPISTVTEIKAKCRKLKLEKGLGLVVIDYLQLMQGKGRIESRQQEISEISRSLKIMAKELDVPVIALSQLGRGPETRSDHRPMLSDLRESGAIEQDADIVMFLYRDEVYDPESEKKNKAEVIIAKHRNGSTGTVELAWLGEYTKFANSDKFRG